MATAEVNSQPRQQPIFWNHLVSWIRSIPRAAILSMVGPSLLCVVGYFGWLYYGAHKLDMAYYGLKKENIHIPPQPGWLKKTNVLDEVFNGSSLSRLSLLDGKTPEVLARVFDAHPCVRKTHRVEKMAGGVVINLEYRIPVAMVHCQLNDNTNGPSKEGFLPVDADAVLLAADNFTPSDVPQFITIFASGAPVDANGNEGKTFGDRRIEEAARLCSLLLPYREAAKISRVMVYSSKQPGKTKWLLEIRTAGGPSFLWGSCPGMEALGEPLPEAKLKLLMVSASDSKTWTQGQIDLSASQTLPTRK